MRWMFYGVAGSAGWVLWPLEGVAAVWAWGGWWLWVQGCCSSCGSGVMSVAAGGVGLVLLGGRGCRVSCCGAQWWPGEMGVWSHRVCRTDCYLPHDVSSVQGPASK